MHTHRMGNGVFKMLIQSLEAGQAGPPRPQVGLETPTRPFPSSPLTHFCTPGIVHGSQLEN